MNPSLPEPDLVEKPPDPLVSPFSGPNSGRRSSSRLALNSLSRKAKDTSGSHVGGKGHTTFVKLNLDDFVNEATANTLINNQNSHQVGEGMSNRIEGDGPNGDDLGLKFSVNGVAMAIDSPVDREAGRFPLPDSSGLVLGDLGLSPCNRPLIPSDVNVCPMNTNISAPPSPFNTDSLGMSSDGIGSESDITPDGSHNQTHQETIESSRKVDFRTLSRNESLDTVTPDPTVISPMLAPVNPDPFRLTQNKIPSTNVWNRNGANRLSFADQIKINNEQEDTRLEYIPPVISPNGGKRVIISVEDLRVTKKHRRTKVKIISNNLSQNRGKIIVNNKVPKSRDSPIVSAPGSSSDPIIQKKMGELHQKFEKSKMPQLRMQNVVPNNQTNPIQPNAPNRKASPKFPPSTTSLPQPRIPAQPKFAGKNASVVHPQSVSHQYVAHGDGVAGIPTSNPFTALDVDMPDAGNSGNMDVAALADEGINEAIKFYEFSPENIADVLHFNPSKLTVPRIHDLSQPPDEPILMDEISDEEIPDFNITNAQKIAICESLEKYGAVKADVQANWEHGEWEFFHYQLPDCGISMVSNGNLSPIPPMLGMTKLLLLHFVMVLDLFLLRMVNWFWDFSRVNWVERAWLERLCGLKVLFLILLFPMPIFYLSVGGYSSFWAGLERVRRTPYYSIPSVESSKCEVGPNNCFYGVGYGMGWNRFAFGLLDITYYWTQVCCCWWTEKGDKKSGLNQDNIVSRSPHFYLGLVSQEPTSGRSFWPNNLARVDSDSHRGSRSWDFNLGAAIDVPRPDPHDVMPSWMSSDFWRLMVLDLILSMVWKKENSSLPSRRSARRPMVGLSANQHEATKVSQPPVDLYSYRPGPEPWPDLTVANNWCATNKSISSVPSYSRSSEAASTSNPTGGEGLVPPKSPAEDLHGDNLSKRIENESIGSDSSDEGEAAGIRKPGSPSFKAVVAGLAPPVVATRVPAADGSEANRGLEVCSPGAQDGSLDPGVTDGHLGPVDSGLRMEQTQSISAGEARYVEPMHVNEPMQVEHIGTGGPLPLHVSASSGETTMYAPVHGVEARHGSTHHPGRSVCGRGKCGVFGHMEEVHNPPPPPAVLEPVVVEQVRVDPPFATQKGKEVRADGFTKVVKKKKRYNGPKPKVQIPSLNVSKPGPSKPSGRQVPKAVVGSTIRAQTTNVMVSNHFSALNDTTHTDVSFNELDATLKECAKRFVDTNTTPPPDIFMTWSTDLKDYYYSLTNKDVVPMQPIEVAKVAPEGGDGINVGLVDDGVGDSPPAPKAVNPLAPAGLASSGASPVPVMADKPPARALDEDGFTIVNRKGKNKSIKLPRKKKQVVIKANPNGLKSILRSTTSSGELSKQGAGLGLLSAPPSHGLSMEVDTTAACTNNRFAALNVVSEQDPFDQSTGTGTSFSELDIHASIRRTTLVEAASDLYPPDPMNEDGTSSARVHSDVMEHDANKGGPGKEKIFCQVNREHVEGARILPTSILSSPSPRGLHSNNGGKSYGISESQRKAIADRISVSSSIRIEETDDWCPGEWDYFNDLCISLGLDPDYCIEDVESDTENGTAQFFSGLLKVGCPKPNRC
ncbi:hypothetical protein L1987_47752 [Smallanthus sonchifolius]|uniref:Uncharacterized protein n=1 Tax=Smallanthus sonchifolius TaxID=185202 RepID=A0ACB9FPD7_9ASTR|nr:hypothetical protein L1987_47752 [Smallanthus sonchifolius]